DAALEHVVVVGRKAAHPRVEVDDLVGVVRLAELDETKPAAVTNRPQDHLEVEVGRLGAPGRSCIVSAGAAGDGSAAEDRERKRDPKGGCERGDLLHRDLPSGGPPVAAFAQDGALMRSSAALARLYSGCTNVGVRGRRP